MRAINPAGLYQRAVHADGLRGQQVVALSQGILRDAGNHPAKAPAADDPWQHHSGLPQSPGTVLVDSFPIIEKLPSHLVEESNRTVPDDLCVGTILAGLLCQPVPFGSPPHAWGQFVYRPKPAKAGRFTPTCVGTICNSARFMGVASGSPPHAWGQFPLVAFVVCAIRFTPTCVGTIQSAHRSRWNQSVHPHMRGDNVLQLVGQQVRARFTPTCVGTISKVLNMRA